MAPEEEGGHVDLFVPLGASGQFSKAVVMPTPNDILGIFEMPSVQIIQSHFTLFFFFSYTSYPQIFKGERAGVSLSEETVPAE